MEAEIPTATLAAFQKAEGDQVRNRPWFVSHSSRLAKILKAGHARPQLIGVFQDQPLEYVQEIIAAAQLDAVQLHGSEPLQWEAEI